MALFPDEVPLVTPPVFGVELLAELVPVAPWDIPLDVPELAIPELVLPPAGCTWVVMPEELLAVLPVWFLS
jgi:hypothetical protein